MSERITLDIEPMTRGDAAGEHEAAEGVAELLIAVIEAEQVQSIHDGDPDMALHIETIKNELIRQNPDLYRRTFEDMERRGGAFNIPDELADEIGLDQSESTTITIQDPER